MPCDCSDQVRLTIVFERVSTRHPFVSPPIPLPLSFFLGCSVTTGSGRICRVGEGSGLRFLGSLGAPPRQHPYKEFRWRLSRLEKGQLSVARGQVVNECLAQKEIGTSSGGIMPGGHRCGAGLENGFSTSAMAKRRPCVRRSELRAQPLA